MVARAHRSCGAGNPCVSVPSGSFGLLSEMVAEEETTVSGFSQQSLLDCCSVQGSVSSENIMEHRELWAALC